jgi:signal transduction histidine kinase
MHAQLLQREQAAAAGTGAESARLILHQADRVESLVNQWLFLARPEPPARSPVDLGALVASEVETLGAMADHAGVVLEVDAVPGAIVSGDRLRLAQVIGNVVRNAIQASPPGGSVRIGVRTDASSGEATVTVRDAGDGFSAAALEQGAEMFFSEKEGGMGVGLSLVRQVVLGHGGQLVLGNERGAVVSIRLPLQPGEGSGS